MLKRGVDVRLIHAKEPGQDFREDFRQISRADNRLCPRVHFKLWIFDCETAYIGSANFTGAGIGMKSPNKRNFESGILTNEFSLVEAVKNQFDNIWIAPLVKNVGAPNTAPRKSTNSYKTNKQTR